MDAKDREQAWIDAATMVIKRDNVRCFRCGGEVTCFRGESPSLECNDCGEVDYMCWPAEDMPVFPPLEHNRMMVN